MLLLQGMQFAQGYQHFCKVKMDVHEPQSNIMETGNKWHMQTNSM